MPTSPMAQPDPAAALSLYRQRAHRYDAELAPFEPLRREAVRLLNLQPGDTVLDLGCGTGLSLPLLAEAVGSGGRVIGLEPCPEMMGVARERVANGSWSQVELQQVPVEGACWSTQRADAALFHFTHDILQKPETIATVLDHLHPGARVVACGLQWAPAWAWATNWWVLSAALYSVTTLSNLHAPWSLLKAALPDLDIRPHWGGSVYMGVARLPPGSSATEPAGHTARAQSGDDR